MRHPPDKRSRGSHNPGSSRELCSMPRHPLSRLLPARILPAALLVATALAPMGAARAEGVVQRVVRTGQLVLAGPPDAPPLLSLDAKGDAQGYAVDVARLVQARLEQVTGKPVKLRFEPVNNSADLAKVVASGQASLACGVPFRWDQDASVDFTLPIGISGLRLLAPAGRFTGAPEALAGRRIGVVRDSLAETELRGMQPAARSVPFADPKAALAALVAGQVDGVIGDSALLAGLVRQQRLSGLALTPEVPYERYAVACVVPENDSQFRDLVNRAITQLLQGYLDGEPQSVAEVDRWLGPGSALNLSQEKIRNVFDSLLMGVEALRPLTAAATR
jgi:polar amino acid transport system substrate-binding protein